MRPNHRLPRAICGIVESPTNFVRGAGGARPGRHDTLIECRPGRLSLLSGALRSAEFIPSPSTALRAGSIEGLRGASRNSRPFGRPC
jgi:hypothetical protein